MAAGSTLRWRVFPAKLVEGLFHRGKQLRIGGVIVYALHFLWVLLKIEKRPFAGIRKIEQLVAVGADAVMCRDAVGSLARVVVID